MQKIYNLIGSLIIISMTFSSCQEEFVQVDNPSEEEQIKVESESFDLLLAMSELDGSKDDFLDDNGCFAIHFPYSITIGDSIIQVNDADYLYDLEEFLDDNEYDEDSFAIVFPIMLTSYDYNSLQINNYIELDELEDDCNEEYISCIDIEYPISFSVYNEEAQNARTVSIENDQDLYVFLSNIKVEEIISLDYPIKLSLESGEILNVNTNSELTTAINTYRDECEIEDVEDEEVITEADSLSTILASGKWVVSLLDSAGVDYTAVLSAYSIEFLEAEQMLLSNGEKDIAGEWETYSEDITTILIIELETEESPFGNFNHEWVLQSIDSTSLKLEADMEDYLLKLNLEKQQ
ncbi:hypothetical protein QYS48_33595 [Marivirga arenosa]|uniref:Uncharacterized protein n=1 Tax=Marivirga arenosa TaxID=3059076 RepID=A0AA51RCQ2_9BACT|nr:hypothetical protein [Marivirga sp. ABR2-2]WMN06754.1 hypothetical protein QYS48_33595 [Marivirga sp. ABR2-2]